MVEELATVVDSDATGVWLSTTPVGSCNACNVSDDCGTGIVAKTLTPRQHRFFVSTTLALLPGEQVRIAVSEQHLLQAAFMVYMLPLLLVLCCAVLASSVFLFAEIGVIVAAAAGGFTGFMLARRYSQWQQRQSEQIHIVEVMPQLGVVSR